MMKKGSIVKIAYIGRVKETGELFDTTDEKLAKEENAYNPKAMYGPVSIIVGEGRTIRGIDSQLLEMNVGEKREFEIPSEEAFGKRSSNLIKLIPQSEFKKNRITPTPGTSVNIGNLNGRILSSNSGRVRVDFNHPLAGRSLDYTVEILEELTKDEDKVNAILEFFVGKDTKFSVKDKKVEIETEVELPEQLRNMITDDIKNHVNGLTTVFSVKKKEEDADKKE